MSEPPASGQAESRGNPSAERVIYRDAEEFKKALDAASESIQKAANPDIIGNIVWWGLLAVLAFLYLAKPAFDLDIRKGLVPGVDLVRPVLVVLAGMFILHLVEIRHRHGPILRKRLCFKCGTTLLGVDVDESGDGTCPKCARPFNLGEYRRPRENRGRGFHGYLDDDHFEKAIYAAAEEIKSQGTLGFEGNLMGWLWGALGVLFGCEVILDWDLLDWVPDFIPTYGIWFWMMLLWWWWYAARVKKIKPAIVAERLCMTCGFCLSHTGTDDDGVGRCPECGAEFVEAQYVRPPKADAPGE